VELQQRRVLEHVGVRSMARTWHNLSPAELYEHAIRRGEAHVVATGALDAETGQHTGRSPKDKFFVKEPSSESRIWWGGNRPIAPEKFDRLLQKMVDFVSENEIYVQDVFACADPRYRLKVRIITENAWHSLFAQNMFIREENPAVLRSFEPSFVVLDAASAGPLFATVPRATRGWWRTGALSCLSSMIPSFQA